MKAAETIESIPTSNLQPILGEVQTAVQVVQCLRRKPTTAPDGKLEIMV
jgi:hypothetical protein